MSGAGLVWLSAALLFAPTLVPPGDREVFQFRFDPTDGAHFQEYEKKTVTRTVGTLPSDLLVLESNSQVSVKKILPGFAFTYVLDKVRLVRNGREEKDLFGDLTNVPVVLECDPRGKVLAIKG